MRLLGFFVVLAALGTLIVWQSGWNPFLPKDYEECRRNARGGYTYYDSRQNMAFAIAGPNPTTEEWAYIEKQYAKYFDDLAKAEEAQRRQMLSYIGCSEKRNNRRKLLKPIKTGSCNWHDLI